MRITLAGKLDNSRGRLASNGHDLYIAAQTIENSDATIIHTGAGRFTVTAEQLTANLTALMNAINRAKPAAAKGIYLRSVVLSSTMGPGIKVNPLKF